MEIKSVKFDNRKVLIDLSVPAYLMSTKNLPGFKENILKKYPSLIEHKCYNEEHQPFDQELNDTLMAHVFEHVLMESIAMKENYCSNIKGETTWDWQRYPRNTYQIEINHHNERMIIQSLAETSVKLKEMINESINKTKATNIAA